MNNYHAIDFRHEQEKETDFPELAELFSNYSASNYADSSHSAQEMVDSRAAFYALINIDELPSALPLAYNIATSSLSEHKSISIFSKESFDKKSSSEHFEKLTEYLKNHTTQQNINNLDSIACDDNNIAARLAPLCISSNALLQHFSRPATAHSATGAKLNEIFSKQNVAYFKANFNINKPNDLNSHSLLRSFYESGRNNSLIKDNNLTSYDFKLPLALLSFSQFPREFLPEVLGLNFALHASGAHASIEKCLLGDFVNLNQELLLHINDRQKLLTELSFQAIELFCSELNPEINFSVRKRILTGIDIFIALWSEWFANTKENLDNKTNRLNEEMVKLIQSKAPAALGYHRSKRLGPHKIDDLFNPEIFKPEDVLKYLAESSHVIPGNAESSPLCNELIKLGGPMAGVFDASEINIIRDWINSLDKESVSKQKNKQTSSNQLTKQNVDISYFLGSKERFLEESKIEYANRPCSTRELYYKLVNIEYFPTVLPIAEQFLIQKLNHARSSLFSGERPIPCVHYSHEVLENWVFNKQREQIDAYVPLKGKPNISKESFVEATVALAPLLFIDGCWLQGASSNNILHSPIGKKLYQIFFEEIGEGSVELHHANIYRELLKSMSVTLPDVYELDFSFSEQFSDASFEVPIIWLSLSEFTRHYFPELLGINLAVELAGIGAGYMEAHDTLKFYGFPTTFVDFHNSSDNASVGHSAIAMNIIKDYMDKIAEQEGHHRLDSYWHRIWTGMRLTLPNSSDFHWNPQEVSALIDNDIYGQASSIFNA